MALRRFVINITAMSSVNVLRLAAQFFAIPILSRLLSPEEYGLVGMAMPFILFAMMIADAGIGTSLVRTSADESTAWSTCFWLSLALGVALAGLMVGLAPATAALLGEPRLEPIIMSLAFIVVAQALVALPGASLQRRHKFKIIAGTEMVPVLIGIATAVIIAVHGGGVWALVGQQLVFYAGRLFLVFAFSSFRPRLEFDWDSVREHVIFGRNMIGTNVLGFLSGSAVNLVMGRVLGSTAVGLYTMGFQFAGLPMMLITGPLQYVLYAQLVRIKDDKAAIRRTFLFLTRALALVIFPAVGMIAAAHQPVFDLFLSPKWGVSGELFMIVAPVCALQAVTLLGATVMMVMGRTDIQLRLTAEYVTLWIAALLASVWFGTWWVAIAYDVAVLVYLPRALRCVLQLIECPVRTYLGAFTVPIIATLLSVGLLLELKRVVQFGEWSQLGVGAAIAVLGIGLSAFLQRHALVREVRAIEFSPSLPIERQL